MITMSAQRAQTAVDDLVALAHAVSSGTLEKDTKAFLAAAKKAADAEKKLSGTAGELKKREDAADRKEKSNASAMKRIKADRDALKLDQDRWAEKKTQEEEALQRDRTRLNNDAAAVKDRDQNARSMMAQAQTMMDAARDLDKTAKAMKTDYEGRLAKLKELA